LRFPEKKGLPRLRFPLPINLLHGPEIMSPIDVYKDWLNIKAENRPLSHYQLLRLKQFEDDSKVIRKHYRQLNAHVRKYASGDYVEQSQSLLNELAKAMLCLTDAQRKQDYDATLGRKTQGPGERRSFEQILLAAGIADQTAIQGARQFADAIGLDIHQAALQKKLGEPSVIMLAYAESIGLPYIELSDIGVDETIAPQVPAIMARQHSCVPVMIDANQLIMASPQPINPDVEEELRLRFDMPVRTVICTQASINEAVKEFFPRDAVTTAPPAASKKSQKKSKPGKVPKPEVEDGEATPDWQIPTILGNFALIGTILTLTFLQTPSFLLRIGAGLLAGIIVGGVSYLVTKSR
jgi:hypothetical protein